MAHGQDKYRSRRNRARVREILICEWDPIGIKDVPQAQDEYDAYVGKVYTMLMDGKASADLIARYLLDVATDRMGMSETPLLETLCRQTAEVLVAARPEFQKESNEPF